MSDIGEIQALLARQRLVGDAQDEDGTRSCWARDSTLEVVLNGKQITKRQCREEVVGFAVDVWRSGGHRKEGQIYLHFDGPADIVLTGEGTARSHSRALQVSTLPGKFEIIGIGDYQDELVHEDGAWRLLHRVVRLTK